MIRPDTNASNPRPTVSTAERLEDQARYLTEMVAAEKIEPWKLTLIAATLRGVARIMPDETGATR